MISKRFPLAKLLAAATALEPCSSSDSTPTPTPEPPAPPALTGADGSYSVAIETTDTAALVERVAFDPDGLARFSALQDSFAGLQAGAGADGILDDTNITNMTTA
jgi:hypothetical protein